MDYKLFVLCYSSFSLCLMMCDVPVDEALYLQCQSPPSYLQCKSPPADIWYQHTCTIRVIIR